MAKHKMNADDFLKILASDDIQEKLKLIFEPLLILAVQMAIKPLQQNFQIKFDKLSATIKTIQADLNIRAA
jgi:hypothetical protein